MKDNNSGETNDVVFPNSNFKYLPRKWSIKINDFQVLVIYDKVGKLNDKGLSNVLYKNIIEGNITNLPIFQDNIESDTFIIWQQSYQENKELFFKLRLNARNELILTIAKVIVTYLLNKYENHFKTSINNHPRLKEKEFIDQLIQKFDYILKNDTFLADYEVWNDFCKWFKTYLTDWVLEDMERTIGLSRLKKMPENQLNELFHKYISKNLSGNSQFMLNFKDVVNCYVQNWITKIISSMDIKNISIDKTIKLLDLNENTILGHNSKIIPRRDITLTLIDQGNLLVMSNAPYQSVRESLSNKSFKSYEYTPWPTAQICKGTIEGKVQIKPYRFDRNGLAVDDQTIIQGSWVQAKKLSELDVDVYDALCSFFLSKAKHHKDIVEIHLDDLLSIRGLKPKLGGNGRRGGYEMKQREQILKALTNLQSLWIDLEKAIIYEKGKPVQMKLQGRAFIFIDQNHNEYCIGNQPLEKKLLFTVDEVFAKFLYGSGRQMALLPVQALQYNPYQEIWEKKLTRYFSWRWRTQARKGDYLQPHKISSLLHAIGKKMNERTPSRTRERLEQALDILLEDGVVASWQYEKWDESIVSNNGWARIWGNSTIVIDPPETIKEQYLPIERNRKRTDKPHTNQKFSGRQMSERNLGEQIKSIRRKLDLTLLQVAEELEISVSYLSNIERGLRIPSNKIKNRVTRWMQLFEFNQ